MRCASCDTFDTNNVIYSISFDHLMLCHRFNSTRCVRETISHGQKYILFLSFHCVCLLAHCRFWTYENDQNDWQSVSQCVAPLATSKTTISSFTCKRARSDTQSSSPMPLTSPPPPSMLLSSSSTSYVHRCINVYLCACLRARMCQWQCNENALVSRCIWFSWYIRLFHSIHFCKVCMFVCVLHSSVILLFYPTLQRSWCSAVGHKYSWNARAYSNWKMNFQMSSWRDRYETKRTNRKTEKRKRRENRKITHRELYTVSFPRKFSFGFSACR